jgi:hypothetical protein
VTLKIDPRLGGGFARSTERDVQHFGRSRADWTRLSQTAPDIDSNNPCGRSTCSMDRCYLLDDLVDYRAFAERVIAGSATAAFTGLL